MAIGSGQFETGEPIDLSRCYEASDRTIANNRRQRRLLSESAVRQSSDAPWFAIKVKPGHELIVENTLRKHGVEALVPMRMGRELRRRHRVIPPAPLPVILGYVLVKCSKSHASIAGLLGVEHVIGLIGGNENPHLISSKEVNEFNEKAKAGYFDWERPASLFRIGYRVKVAAGMFSGLSGTIVSCRSDGRGDAVVELVMFGRMTPVLMPLAILSPL